MTRTPAGDRPTIVPGTRLRPVEASRRGAFGAVPLAAIAPILWGTTYLATTELLPPGRPLLAGTLRAVPAGVLLAAATRRPPHGAWWAKAAVLGTLNIGGFFLLLFTAAYRLPGGVAATLGAIQPILAAGLAAALLGERLRGRVLLAGTLGLVGVGLLVLRADARLDLLGVAAGLGGAASMATGVVLTKRWGRPVGLLAFTSWQLLAGGLLLVPATLASEGLPDAWTTAKLAVFLWLSLAGTALAYSLWFRGIERLPIARLTLLGLLAPVVATSLGWVVLGQALGLGQLAGMALVLLAVWIGQSAAARGGSRRARLDAPLHAARGRRAPRAWAGRAIPQPCTDCAGA